MTVAIVGVGETVPSFVDARPVARLAIDACRLALADAGLDASDVDGFVTEAATLGGQAPIDEVAQRLGVRSRPFSAHIGIAGSGTVGAALLAKLAIESGVASVVVSYYAINLSRRGRNVAGYHAGDHAKACFEMPMGYYGQPVYFAAQAARYAYQYGLEGEQLGAIALSARRHAQRTPDALRQKPLQLDHYLADEFVAEPLRRLDCCLVNDAGVAFVMTSMERARDLRRPPVRVAGAGFASKPLTQSQYFTQGDILATPAVDSGRLAFEMAGLHAGDVDFAEIYDCSSISMMLQLEDLGLSPRGESAARAAAGDFDPGGPLPINTHGGLLSQSYSVGGGHVVEAVRQLREERAADGAQVDGAEVALVCGLGAPEHATLLLTQDR